ncbi:MAG TPA: FHA domain-containing protein [Chloroflexia bacterium]|nr:FHA domain-containing protein [Chloroflexia bacterium]
MSAGSYAPAPAPTQAGNVTYSSPPAYSAAPISSGAGSQADAAPGRQIASLVVLSPPPPATIPIPDRAELIVGRADPQSNSYPDIDLGPYGGLDLGVSRRHFRLTRTGEQIYLEDLNAMNGTLLNGQRVPAYRLHPLRKGDLIALGKMELRLEME